MAGLFGAHKATTHATRAMGIDFQGAQYGPVVPVVYGRNKVPGNCVWYGDFQSHAQQQKAGKGGGGGSTTNYTYSASAQMGLCEGPGIGLQTVYDGTSIVNLSSINYAFASGAKGQAPWSHLSGSTALGYSLTALFSFQNLDLGSQASLPNYNYEVNALKQFSGGIPDANPRDILTDICSDPYHGVNFPWLGDLTQYSNFCVANSLFLSPVYDQQQTANQALSDLFKYTNAYVYYSEDQLKVVPLGDAAVTGNGVTFTPNVTPVVNLGTDDFIADGSGATITVDRKAPQDNLNLVRVEFKDRSNTYHDSAVVGAIDEDIITNGGRSDDSETVNGCTGAAVARFIAQNLVQRAFYIRNTYQFKLTWRYCYLEPTDIVTLTDAALGLSLYPVRITEIEEDGDSALTITAEEFPEGIGHSAIYNTQPNGGTNIDQNSDPGAVNPPYLFRGPGFLVSNNTPEIWSAVNGSNPMWAGCDVYLSHDGSSYTFAGTVASQARYGQLTTPLAVGAADPDTTNTPSAQVYAPAELLGGSQTDADNFVTLAMVDSEIIAYETATLTAAQTYQLGYLRRGGYGSSNVAHNTGAPFVRLDESIFRMPVDPSLIGSTVYLKFLSLNAFGRTPRTLAEETAYTYVVGTNVELPDVPNVPDNFAVQGVADGVSITWSNDNPASVGCTSIERSPDNATWAVLAQVGPTTTAYHDSFTTGATYYYRARARGPLVQSGWSAYTDVFNSTGVDVSAIANTANTANANTPTVFNPNFVLGLTGWNAGTGWSSDATPRAVYTGGAYGSGVTQNLGNQSQIATQPGQQCAAQCLISANGANGNCRVNVGFYDINNALLSRAFGNLLTGTAALTLSRVVAVSPANAVYCRIGIGAANCTTGTYTVQDCWLGPALASLDELPDSSTRFAASETGADKTSGKPLSSLSGRTLDVIGDSATRFAAAQAGADKTSSNPQASTWLNDSANLARGGDSITRFGGRTLDNVGDSASRFAAAQAGADKTSSNTSFDTAARHLGDNLLANGDFELGDNYWIKSSTTEVTINRNSTSAYAGNWYMEIRSLNGTAFNYAQTGREPVRAGQTVSVSLQYRQTGSAGPDDLGIALFFYDDTGADLTSGGLFSNIGHPTSYTLFQKFYTAPALSASMILRIQTQPNGTMNTFHRIDQVALQVSMGAMLTAPGSGQTVGDQRNLLPVTWAGVRSVLSTSPISFSISGTTVNFSAAAVTVNAGGVNVSYSPSSGSVTQAAGTEVIYYLYYRDPTAAGGSQSLHITTSVQALAAYPDIVLLGSADVTVASGGGGTGGTGGGGGGFCVADDMYIGEGRRAGDAEVGDLFDCIDLPTAAGKHVRALQGLTRGMEECVRLITSDGCALVCSISTPFDLLDGRQTTAPHMLGEQVITDLGTATVISLALVGPRPVTRAHLGGVSYAAGADPHRRIYSHNVGGVLKP